MPNRLILEKSPYLRQHGDNPVDWYPWGEEAFAAAADLNRPVFLSIGYSSCHWCHVMERESFRDPGTALLLNRDFIAIKVDREERPDIDAHYLAVCQLLTGSAGWPLSVFLTPDRRAFFAGTYFPRERRFGLAGFNDLVERIARAWKVNPREVLDSARRIAAAARETGDSSPRAAPGPELLDRAFGRLSEEFDPVHGGFGGAPKFPQPHRLLFLLRYAQRTDDRRALEIVGKTLRAMRRGGIFDQLGFGFHRYATDAGWSLPHFEKLLCDQALLIMAYTEAFQATGRREFGRTAEETIAYVLRELVSAEGGFLTAEDADSEGEEGRYYLWDAAEVRASLGPAEAEFAARVFGLEAGEGAGPGSPAGGGRRVLRLVRSPETEGRRMGMSPDEAAARWEALRARLLAVRERRPRPFKDGKVLTDWNGLMIAALAKAARALDKADPAGAAVRAAAFIKDGLCPGGMLRHRYADGEAAVTALLDDHAFLIWGLIELYETVYDPAALAWALRLTDEALEGFWDDAGGGFFQTHRESRDLPWRRKESYDGAVPSGNSAMLANLLRLGRLTGRAELEEAAGRLAGALAGTVFRAPEAHTLFLCGLDLALGPSREVVVIGGRDDPRTRRLLEPLRRQFLPRDSVVFRPADEPAAPILELVPHARSMSVVQGRPTAYVCSGSKCDPPTTDPRALRRPARQRGTGIP